jgi:hypothetical protein
MTKKELTMVKYAAEANGTSTILSKVVRVGLGLALAAVVAGRAGAQTYPGGTGTGTGTTPGGTYTPPKGGYGSGAAVGAGVGAAAGAGLLFLAFHHSSTTGCVQPGDDGLRFVDDKKNTSYALVPGDVLVKPGDRVQLRGQKSKSASGVQTFTAKKLVKDLGSCSEAKTTAEAKPAKQEHY